MHYSKFLSTAEREAIAHLELNTLRRKIVSMGWTYERTDNSAHQYVKGDRYSQMSPRIVFYFERPNDVWTGTMQETHCKSVCAIAEAEDFPTALVVSALAGEFPWPMALKCPEILKDSDGNYGINVDVLDQKIKLIWKNDELI